ncbi:MAG: DeoR/GlpR family DNA-binding transcription regulator [Opitutales bacterium]
MLQAERHRWIVNQLALHEVLRAEELASDCGVTLETIRKDLIVLEEKGRLKRTRGGAQRLPSHRFDLPLPERESLNRPAKAAIARTAARLIRPRDTVFLDASSTVLTMTEFFPTHEVTVMTNASHVVVALGGQEKVDLICTGGDYERRSRSYVGLLAEEAVQRYYLQWFFIGVDAFDGQRGASEVNPGQARLKERILPLAERVCVLADHTKLERKSAFFFARPRQVHLLITDAAADPAILARYREGGIEVLVAEAEAHSGGR